MEINVGLMLDSILIRLSGGILRDFIPFDLIQQIKLPGLLLYTNYDF